MEKAREIGRVLGLICLGVLTVYTIIVYFTYIKGWGEPVGYEMIEIKLMTMHEYIRFIIVPVGLLLSFALRSKKFAGMTMSLECIFYIVMICVSTHINSDEKANVVGCIIIVIILLAIQFGLIIWMNNRMDWYVALGILLLISIAVLASMPAVLDDIKLSVGDSRRLHATLASFISEAIYVLPFAVFFGKNRVSEFNDLNYHL